MKKRCIFCNGEIPITEQFCQICNKKQDFWETKEKRGDKNVQRLYNHRDGL